MSKNVMVFSLKEMCIVKHSVLKSINEKQGKLLKSIDEQEVKSLSKDIIDENRFYDKMVKNIAEFKKENNIQ